MLINKYIIKSKESNREEQINKKEQTNDKTIEEIFADKLKGNLFVNHNTDGRELFEYLWSVVKLEKGE